MYRVNKIMVSASIICALVLNFCSAEKVLFDFGQYASSVHTFGWNNIGFGEANVNGWALYNAVDTSNQPTTIDLRMVDAFGPNCGGGGCTSSSAFNPVNPSATEWFWYIWQGGSDGAVTIRIEGLNPGDLYDFGFYASYMSDNDARRECKYIIGAKSVNLVPNYNCNTVAHITDVSPDTNGYVTIQLAYGAAPEIPDKIVSLAVLSVERGARSRKLNFNFGNAPSTTNVFGWNNIGSGEADLNGFMINYAKDNNNDMTTTDLHVIDAFPAANYLAIGYTDSTAFSPAYADATRYSWYVRDGQADQSVRLRVEGLVPGEVYNLGFYSSNTSTPKNNYLTKYAVGSNSVILQPGGNHNTIAYLNNIPADSSGYITIDLGYGAGPEVGTRMASLAAMTVEGLMHTPTSEDLSLFNFKKKFANFVPYTQQQLADMNSSVAVASVVAPYQSIICSDANTNKYTLTTSEWTFANSILPSSIKVFGEQMLSSGLDLAVTSEDSTLPRTVSTLSVTNAPESIILSQDIDYSKWTLHIEGQLLYDGLLIYTINIIPHSSQQIRVDSINFSIPYAASKGKYIRYYGFTENASTNYGFGPIPAPGEHIQLKYNLLNGAYPNYWNPLDTTQPSAVLWEWKQGMLPYFWIGSEKDGIGWICEGARGWKNAAQDTTFKVVRNSGLITGVVSMITQSVTVSSPRQLQFAIQAYPPKPKRNDWLRLKASTFNVDTAITNYNQLTPEQRLNPAVDAFSSGEFTSLWWTYWSQGMGTPRVRNQQALHDSVEASFYYGCRVLPYLTPTHLTVNSEEGYYYGAKTKLWASKPYEIDLPTDGNQSYAKTCTASFFSQYQAWAIGQMIDQYNIKGVYFDNCGIRPCMNSDHGCGYTDDSGYYRTTIPFFAVRNFFQMVRNEFQKRGIDPLICAHAGDYPAEISFIDFILIGEGVYGLDHTQDLTPGEMRAQMLGINQSGVIELFLPQMYMPQSYGTDSNSALDPNTTRHLLCMTLPNSTKIWPFWCNKMPVLYSWDVFNMLTEGSSEFIPYWEWSINSQLNSSGVYASLYKEANKAVLAISNISASAANNVSISASGLDSVYPGIKTATDTMDNLPLTFNQSGLTLNIAPKDFRLILLDRTPQECTDYMWPHFNADLNKDCYVNWPDFRLLTQNWLNMGCASPDYCAGSDIDKNTKVNLSDISKLTSQWLNCNEPHDANCD